MPKIEAGDVVTYTYVLSVKGNFRNPKILRKRSDLRWDDLLQREVFNEVHRKKIDTASQLVKGYFHSENGKNIRIFFENLASAQNFDPLVAENWYKINFYDIMKRKGGAAVLKIYRNSWSRAIIATFPDIGLDLFKFNKVPQHYWKEQNNQKNFFLELAKKRGFDALVPEHWYNISYKEYKKESKIGSFLVDKVCNTLQSLFPEVRFDPMKFTGTAHWRSWHNRKLYFDSLAAHHQFDPLVISNWYLKERQITQKISTSGKGRGMFGRYYKSSIKTALEDLYINTK